MKTVVERINRARTRAMSVLFWLMVALVTNVQPVGASVAINTTFGNLLNLGTAVGLAVATFFVCVAGYHWMSSGAGSNEKAKGATINALVGLGIVLAARIIARAVSGALPAGAS
jgi:cation transport ATPase